MYLSHGVSVADATYYRRIGEGMKVIIADKNMKILSTIVGSQLRVPIMNDYVCFHNSSDPQGIYQEMEAQDGRVVKVMIDYIQEIAIVTVDPDYNR